MFHKIVVAVDGSKANVSAQLVAAGVSAATSGELLLVCVMPVRATLVAEERAALKAGDVLDDARWRIEAAGGRVSKMIDRFEGYRGAPGEILSVAQEEMADLIITGTRGHRSLAGAVLGSVSQRLLHNSPCPVLVVPEAGR